jgi:hypothetical protein
MAPCVRLLGYGFGNRPCWWAGVVAATGGGGCHCLFLGGQQPWEGTERPWSIAGNVLPVWLWLEVVGAAVEGCEGRGGEVPDQRYQTARPALLQVIGHSSYVKRSYISPAMTQLWAAHHHIGAPQPIGLCLFWAAILAAGLLGGLCAGSVALESG